MAPFVPLVDYLAWADITDPGEVARAQVALNSACDRVRRHRCQTIDLVTGDVLTLPGSDTRALMLPELPVNSVTSVIGDGVAVTDWMVDGYGILWRTTPNWWPRSSTYVVTYSHGWAPANVPGDIREVTFKLAQVEAGGGVQQESIDGYSVIYQDTTSLLSSLEVVKRVPLP